MTTISPVTPQKRPSPLATGGMADVHLAAAPTGRAVAVKVLRAGAEAAGAWRREFRPASAVDAECTAPALRRRCRTETPTPEADARAAPGAGIKAGPGLRPDRMRAPPSACSNSRAWWRGTPGRRGGSHRQAAPGWGVGHTVTRDCAESDRGRAPARPRPCGPVRGTTWSSSGTCRTWRRFGRCRRPGRSRPCRSTTPCRWGRPPRRTWHRGGGCRPSCTSRSRCGSR